MLSCKEATKLMSEAQERPLSFKEKVSLGIHTPMCSACRNFNKNLNNLRSIMRGFAKGKDEE